MVGSIGVANAVDTYQVGATVNDVIGCVADVPQKLAGAVTAPTTFPDEQICAPFAAGVFSKAFDPQSAFFIQYFEPGTIIPPTVVYTG
jgi:hypothetical protein